MSDWYGSARSNYVKVKDPAAFGAAMEGLGITVWPPDRDGRLAFGVQDGDDGGWPSERYNDEAGDWVEFDIFEVVAEHLADGEVAVLQEVGAEKLRYLSGWATAVGSDGETVSVSIDDIYALAKAKLGVNPTPVFG